MAVALETGDRLLNLAMDSHATASLFENLTVRQQIMKRTKSIWPLSKRDLPTESFSIDASVECLRQSFDGSAGRSGLLEGQWS